VAEACPEVEFRLEVGDLIALLEISHHLAAEDAEDLEAYDQSAAEDIFEVHLEAEDLIVLLEIYHQLAPEDVLEVRRHPWTPLSHSEVEWVRLAEACSLDFN
jgi:hypothetical protein